MTTKLTLNTGALRALYETARRSVSESSPAGHADCVRLRAADGALAMTACDLSSMASHRMPCDGEMDILVPARKLASALEFAGEEIALSLSPGKVVFSSGSRRATVGTLDGAQALEIKADPVGAVKLRHDGLLPMIRRAAWAAAKKDFRPEMRCVHISASNGELACAATDGAGMVIVRGAVDPAVRFSALLPAAQHQLLDDGLTDFVFCANAICASAEGRSVVVSTYQGSPRSWRGVLDRAASAIGGSESVAIEADAAALAECLRMVGAFTDEDIVSGASTRRRPISISASAGTLTARSARSVDSAEASCEVTGDLRECYFDAVRLLGIVNNVGEERVRLVFYDKETKVVAATQDGATYITTGVRV